MNRIYFLRTPRLIDLFKFDPAANSQLELEIDEKWALIKGFPDYAISSNGRCWSRNRHMLLSQQRQRNGYYSYRLYHQGIPKNFYVHRLVLMSFKPIKNMRHFQVCHIDESRDNNRLENLQWGTARYNCNQRMHLKRLRNSHRGHTVSLETRRAISRGNRGREVYQCDLKGVVLKKWDYISIAARNLGISPSNISKCCRGLRESAGGFKWKYVIRGE